jgi:hypothetical protein
MPHARQADKPTSHRAVAAIKAAAKHDPHKVRNAVLECVQMGRNFTHKEIAKLMKLHHPGDNEESGSICSKERIRGVLSELEDEGRIVLIDDSGERGVFRFVPVVEVKTQKGLFDEPL